MAPRPKRRKREKRAEAKRAKNKMTRKPSSNKALPLKPNPRFLASSAGGLSVSIRIVPQVGRMVL